MTYELSVWVTSDPVSSSVVRPFDRCLKGHGLESRWFSDFYFSRAHEKLDSSNVSCQISSVYYS